MRLLVDAISNNYPNTKKILITNASLINDRYISDFVASNMELIISLDGAGFDSYRLNRPIGNFNSIVNTLKKIGDKRLEIGNPKFSFIINMVVTRENYHCIGELVELAKKVGVDFLHISEVRECMPDKEVWNKLKLEQCEERDCFEECLIKCEQRAKEIGLGFSFNPYEKNNELKKKICISPWQHVFIGADGSVKFCCEQNYVIGNLLDNSFDELWNGERSLEFRNRIIVEDYHPICMNCCLPWGITYE